MVLRLLRQGRVLVLLFIALRTHELKITLFALLAAPQQEQHSLHEAHEGFLLQGRVAGAGNGNRYAPPGDAKACALPPWGRSLSHFLSGVKTALCPAIGLYGGLTIAYPR